MKRYIQPIIKLAAMEPQSMIAESLPNDDHVISDENEFDARQQQIEEEELDMEDYNPW